MDFYKPVQSDLLFVYNHILNNLNIKSTVRVLLQAGESLTLTSSYNNATRTSLKLFDHALNQGQPLPYEFVDNSIVEIMSHIDIPYDEHDQQGFITKLRAILAGEYTVTVTVNDKPDHSASGGSDTGTIKNSGTIIID
jgi:hypothetical protein